MPKFATPLAQAQIDQLMQPALIRVIDNIRKQLDSSEWQGSYEEELIWPEATSDSQKETYAALQKQLHGVPPAEHDRVAALMSQLPQPMPLYTLRLTKSGGEDQTVDIWALCYRVCAMAQPGKSENALLSDDSGDGLEADDRLFDEAGEVDWQQLDDKSQALVESIFHSLPA
jgi:hypothetical protein